MRVVLMLLLLPVNVIAQDLPKVHLLYPPDGTIFDRSFCPQSTKTEIKPEWVQETVRRRAELQALWDTEGPKYLETALSEIGSPFPYREMQAYLTVCAVGGSMSMPLLINMRPFLASTATVPGLRWPESYFPGLVFHELMHHYVSPVSPVSKLRRKYSSEVPQTLNHLHVMALEKVVFSRLRLSSELKFLDQAYRTTAPPAYKRAWEIVNDVEGEHAFIAELKSLPAKD